MEESRNIKILCVDDEKNVLKALGRLFLDEDYDIFSAASGEEGLEILAAEGDVQIVISDYRMPGMNGVDFLKEVFLRWPDTVRIVLSGYADIVAIVGAINEGQIYKFIPKPWNDDELKVTIANAVERYFLKQKNIQLMQELKESNDRYQMINENLEQMVQERTDRVLLHNEARKIAHNILDALPLAIFCIGSDGLVVQCNTKGTSYLGKWRLGSLGSHRRHVLPEVLNAFVDKLESAPRLSGTVPVNGQNLSLFGAWLGSGQANGLVLAFWAEDQNG